MAVEPGDPTNGFRYADVIQFINSEILSNGGGPDFYLNFCSRSWNEVEDGLNTILTDQQVPRAFKRACAWSALALAVRAVARQEEQQAHQLRGLREQIEQREATCRALVFEMRRMRVERDQATAQLHSMRASSQQALNQRDMFLERLLQTERSASAESLPQEVVPYPGTEQHGAAAQFLDQTQVMTARAQGMPHLGTQTFAPEASHYVGRSPGPWAQPTQPALQMQVPHRFPLPGPHLVRFPYSAPPPALEVRESAAGAMAAGVPQMLPTEIYQSDLWTAVGSQEEMAPLWDQSFHGQYNHPENLQDSCHQVDSTSHSQEGDPQCPRRMTSLVNKGKGPERLQETGTLTDSSHSQKEVLVAPQGMVPQGDSSSHSQKGEWTILQGTALQGISRIQSMIESPKKQRLQRQNTKQPHRKKASESPKEEESASLCHPGNWICSQCKAVNLPRWMTCHKCRKTRMPVGDGGFEPGQIQ